MITLMTGTTLSFLISYFAYKKDSLSFSGFIGTLLLGTLLYMYGSMYFWSIIVGFFVSSSVLTKFRSSTKEAFEDISEKTGGRDYMQVIANGGLGLIYALLYYFTKDTAFVLSYAVAFSAANADTWSSELGVLSKSRPVSILTFKKTSTGESGAVSQLGTFAAFCGSFFISAIFIIEYIFSFGWTGKVLIYFIIVLLCGFSGSIIDSILGATIQAKYQCSVCKKITEKKYHHNMKTVPVKGFKIISNDVVNFASSLIATLVSLAIYYSL
jgi:uncharacterized protein (TIGR00297 family)